MNIATFICIVGGFVAGLGSSAVKRSHDSKKKAAKDNAAKGERK